MPLAIRNRHQLLLKLRLKLLDQPRIAGKADLQRILNHQRQQQGGRLGAQNRPFEARREQLR